MNISKILSSPSIICISIMAILGSFQNCAKVPFDEVEKPDEIAQDPGAKESAKTLADPHLLLDGYPATIDGKNIKANSGKTQSGVQNGQDNPNSSGGQDGGKNTGGSNGSGLTPYLVNEPQYSTLVEFNCGNSTAQKNDSNDPIEKRKLLLPDQYLIEKPPVRFYIINTSDYLGANYQLKSVCSFDDKDNSVRDYILNNKVFNYVMFTKLIQEGCPSLVSLVGNLPSRKFSFVGESIDDNTVQKFVHEQHLIQGTMVLLKNSFGKVVAFQEQGISQWVSTFYDKNKSNPNCDRPWF